MKLYIWRRGIINRILIIGGNGSGKTTLANELSNKLKLPLTHLDVLYWRDNWNNATNEEFDELVQQEVTKSKWIIDGNSRRTLPLRLKYCDTVIYMDYSRARCVFGVLKRVIKNFGKSRPDMGGYCPENLDAKFLKAVWNFNKRNRKYFYDILSHKNNVKTIILKNPKQVAEFLKRL